MKNKIVIDTNILYTWAALSLNDKISASDIDDLTIKYELYVTTTSLLEVIVKHRNDIASIKKCLGFIFEKKLQIISIGFTPISNAQLETIYFQTDENIIKKVIEHLFKLKIQKETEFLRFFLVSLITSVVNSFIEKSGLSEKSDNYKMLVLHSKAMIEGNLQHLYDTIQNTLIEGYSNDNVKQAVKSIFSIHFHSFFSLWKINYYTIINNLSISDFKNADQKIKEKIHNSIKTDNFLKSIKRHSDNPLAIFSKKEYRVSTEDYLSGLKNHLSQDIRFTSETINYLFEKFNKYLLQKKKIDKNDVLDLLIIYSLYLKDFLILTLDNDFIDFLEKHHKDSFALINTILSKRT